MASVFLARDRLTDQPVALKVFAPENADVRLRFEREAEVLSGLEHAGIVRYLAHGAPPDGSLYLAMEYLEGEDLESRLDRGPLSIEETLVVARRVAEALSVAHARGVVHRDIKPANLFLVSGSVHELKVIDFGIARIEAASTLTRAGFTLGTPDYMAPEQARGDATLTPAIDVFSLGCVLFECLAARTPFAADHPLAILSRILLEEPPSLRELRKDVPQVVDELVRKLLSKNTSVRPKDARAALELIDATADLLLRSRSAESDEEPLPSLTGREKQLLCLLFVDGGREGWNGIETLGLTSIVAEYGGRAMSLVDGTLLVLLPGRGAASEQAVRAARCALALEARVASRSMALVTGRAVVSASVPVGDLIDRGVALLAKARAQQTSGGTDRLAAKKGIDVDSITAELVGSAFDLDESADGTRLGKLKTEGGGRTLLGRYQPCVGRNAEIAELSGQFAATLRDGSARALLVTGAPGIGKSRLRTEAMHALSGLDPRALFVLGRGDPARFGLPFGLLAAALRGTFGLREDEPLEHRHEKILRHVSAALDVGGARGTSAASARHVAELLGELVGAPFPDVDSPLLRAARADGIRLGDQMWRAWVAYLDRVTQSRTVVFVLDDVDFADLPSLTFIDAALRNFGNRKLVVLAFARPEIDERFPGLWSGRNLIRFSLEALSDRASAELVAAAIGDEATPDVTRRIVERAAGNPLYLEEIVRAVVAGKGDELPATVLAMVEARLDALAPSTRRVLRSASIFGRVSWRSAMGALCGGVTLDLDAALDELVRREILVVRGVVTFEGELEYAFRHALVRDTAYATLTEDDRVLGHDLAGRWLAERRPGEVVTIAEHFAKGGQPNAAIAWYERGAQLALEGNDFSSSIERAERAILCGAEGLALGKLKLLISECHRHRGANVEMLALAEEAREIVVRGTTGWFRAVANVVLGAIRLGRKELVDGCIADLGRELTVERESPLPAAAARTAHYLHFAGHHDFATRLLSVAWSGGDAGAESASDPANADRAAWFHRACATRALILGDLGSYLEHIERAVTSFDRVGDVREAASERVNLGFARMELGLYPEAEVTLREALRDADALGLSHAGATARENLGAVLTRLGALTEARSLLEEAIETFSSQKNRRMEGNARVYLGELLGRVGETEAAERELVTSIERLASVKPLLPMALAALALLQLQTNRIDEAAATSARASEALSSVGHPDEGEALIRLAEILVFIARGRQTEARASALSARDRLLERAAKIREPRWRSAFLAVEENARTLELAEAIDLESEKADTAGRRETEAFEPR